MRKVQQGFFQGRMSKTNRNARPHGIAGVGIARLVDPRSPPLVCERTALQGHRSRRYRSSSNTRVRISLSAFTTRRCPLTTRRRAKLWNEAMPDVMTIRGWDGLREGRLELSPSSAFKAAKASFAVFVRTVSHDSMDSASFFFSFESDLPEIVLGLVSDGLRKGPQLGVEETLASPVFIVQNEACLPWDDKPRHHTSTGRDWPHKRSIPPHQASRAFRRDLGSRSPIGHSFRKRLIRLIYGQQNSGLGARHSAGTHGGTERDRTPMIRQIRN